MREIGYKLRIINAFNFRYSTEKRNVPSFLSAKTICEASSRLDRFDTANGGHSFYLLLFELSRLRPCTVQRWVKSVVPGLFKFNSVLQRVDRFKLSVSNDLKPCKHVHIFVVMIEIFVQQCQISRQPVLEILSDYFTALWRSLFSSGYSGGLQRTALIFGSKLVCRILSKLGTRLIIYCVYDAFWGVYA